GAARLAVVEAFSLSFHTWPAVLAGTPIVALIPAKLAPVTVLLAVLGVARRSFSARFLGAAFCVVALLATQPNPLYRVVQAIPPFGFFGGPIKYFYVAVFVAVVLSGLGLESALAALEGSRRSATRNLLARSLLLVVVGESGLFLHQTGALEVGQPWGARVYGPFQSLVHESLLDGARSTLTAHAAQEDGMLPRPGPRLLALIARGDQLRQVGLNFGALWGIEALNGVGPLAQWRQLEVMEAAQVEHAAELARELAADPLVVARGSPLEAKLVGAGYEPLGAEPPNGLRMLSASKPAPRYLLVAHARAASADEAIAAARIGRALDGEAVLIEGEASELGAAATPGDADGVLELTAWRPGALRARVSVSRPTWLVAREPFYRNWRATIDGRSATVRPAGGFFLALLVPSGAHEVELAYHEPGLAIGACIALVALLALWYVPRRLAGSA
ncbi:MAG TPA: YfhO family protein, partial [Candidatus Bathyarchaeia archaeon]|nr:YfhO family protein [Candidatus Bathyarchaeia archaeon]